MLPLHIALRYLVAKKRHNAVNIISWISVAGVGVATAAIVCVLSVFNGFTDLAHSRLSAIDPQIKIVPTQGKTFANADSLASLISSMPTVSAAIPVVEERALAIYNGMQVPLTIKGIPPGYDTVAPIESTVIDGEMLLYDGDYPCITLSVGAAISLGATPGGYNTLCLYTPRRKGRINPANPMATFKTDTLLVAAVYEVKQTDYDLDRAYVPLTTARHLLDYTTQASAIELRLAPSASLTDVMNELNTTLAGIGTPLNQLMQQQESFRMIAVEKWLTFLMLTFILVVASFNIISTVSMLIIEKKDNIATLRALGATPGQVRSIFFCEGWLISIIGGIAGIILGLALCLAQQHGGFIKLGGDPSQLSITVYPVAVQATDIAAIAAIVMAVGAGIGLITSSLVPNQIANNHYGHSA